MIAKIGGLGAISFGVFTVTGRHGAEQPPTARAVHRVWRVPYLGQYRERRGLDYNRCCPRRAGIISLVALLAVYTRNVAADGVGAAFPRTILENVALVSSNELSILRKRSGRGEIVFAQRELCVLLFADY